MKRLLLALLLAVLLLLELWFLESFLPYGWHHPISELLNRVFPSQPYASHPRMDLEIEMFLRDHPLWRICSYALTAFLAIANGVLISKAWKALRKLNSGTPQS